tara:strand:+ start:6471 stop:6917 length:447 start_codon:yes stop_codon:yes gene_type:complete
MNDTYRLPLTKDESILLILKELLHHNTDICKLIIYKKNTIEAKDTMDYYYDRWENIAGSHYRLHDTHDGKYSLIWDDSNYKVKKDHNPIFYNLTGISYQIIELLHELIKINRVDSENSRIEDYKYWLTYNDKLFSFLANKIKIAMNES